MRIRLIIIAVILLTGKQLFAQDTLSGLTIDTLHQHGIPERSFIKGDSLLIINGSLTGICKDPGKLDVQIYRIEKNPKAVTGNTPRKSLIEIHGNILYNFDYRSYIDTPFAQKDLMQHLLQTHFNLLIKEKYPAIVTISNRWSNSAYFKNTFDVNVKFTSKQLLENIKDQYRNDISALKNSITGMAAKAEVLKSSQFNLSKLAALADLGELSTVAGLLKNNRQKIDEVKSWLSSAARLQEIVEQKEKALNPSLSEQRSMEKEFEKMLEKGNSFLSLLTGNKIETETIKKLVPKVISSKLDSLNSELHQLKESERKYEAKLRSIQKSIEDSLSLLRKEIAGITSGPGLYAFMRRHDLDRGQLTSAQKILLSIRQAGIGRSMVDYSELTVKNISIAGVHAELNPLPFYLAFAGGKVNYLSRDFIRKNRDDLPSQSVAIARAGLGNKDGNNFILSFYSGKKTVLNGAGSSLLNATQKISGVSAESKFSLDADNYIVAEFAKSSGYDVDAPSPAGAGKKIFNFKDHSNEAYSIKLAGRISSAGIKFNGYYKKLGEHFQSFTLYPSGVNQEAWLARVNQEIWKRRITIEASVRKNDFVSPWAAPSFNSSTIFKSFRATANIPKYPFVSVGYYPSTQLLVSSNNTLVESQYNTLNAFVSHNYQFRKIRMNTYGTFTRFYNSSDDTSFIYFNARSYLINQNIYLDKWSIQTGAGFTEQENIKLFSLEQAISMQADKNVSVGAGIKWNRLNKSENLFGANAKISFVLRRVGSLQFNYEKTYLPAGNRELKPVDIGRVSFYREF